LPHACRVHHYLTRLMVKLYNCPCHITAFISGKMKVLESVVLSFHHHWPLSYVANWLSEVHWHVNTSSSLAENKQQCLSHHRHRSNMQLFLRMEWIRMPSGTDQDHVELHAETGLWSRYSNKSKMQCRLRLLWELYF